ncbi:carbohydrate ABC transporter permease [uncultured Sphaerochaeta sp.]|uniref:carbohydrate ABC transporter permease n=1 Tax=uncultured Sphaerochaeta sp. TaxID=886478 RepID=UPI0029CA9FE4|nr:carbohydrate ABC transporter permease [uncultured Sphaerochaeta sp.]
MPSNNLITPIARMGKIIKTTILSLLTALFLILAIFPILWLISTSLRTGLDVYSPSLLPAKISFESYEFVIHHSPFFQWFINSVLISISAMFLSVIVASLAAYSMSRFVTKWKQTLSKSILFAYMFPPILLVLPLFMLFVELGLLDRKLGLIFAYSMSNLPFAMWLLAAYFETIPKEIDEAAKIDGAGNNYIFWRMIIPMAAPGLATSAIFVFINAWNEFVLALTLINSDANKTLPIGLYAQMGGKAGELVLWNNRMATSALVILPMLLVFLSLNKYITKGLTAGALKG